VRRIRRAKWAKTYKQGIQSQGRSKSSVIMVAQPPALPPDAAGLAGADKPAAT
jgi:hypothetical protein